MTRSLSQIFDLVVLASTLIGLVAGGWAVLRPLPAPRAEGRPSRLRWLAHPLAQWAIVWLLLVLNQVAFNAYVLRAHHGSVAFVARYIAERGWFALAPDFPGVRLLAAHAGADASWLAPSVLRVQAYLELPFTLYAYLAVARILGRDVVRALVRWPVLFAASISFSVTFGLVEVFLTNPYTRDDLVLRALAAITVPFWVRFTSRADDVHAARAAADPHEGRPTSLLGVLLFLAGAASIAAALLVAYDALLLYNLAHLAPSGPYVAGAWAFAVASSFLVPRLPRGRDEATSPSVALLGSALFAFTVVFFVPSLAIRYRLPRELAERCGLAVAVAGVLLGVVLHVRARGVLGGRGFLASGAGLAAGLSAVALVSKVPRVPRDLAVALVTLAFLGAFALASRAAERALA